jgi:hypothetical protein
MPFARKTRAKSKNLQKIAWDWPIRKDHGKASRDAKTIICIRYIRLKHNGIRENGGRGLCAGTRGARRLSFPCTARINPILSVERGLWREKSPGW